MSGGKQIAARKIVIVDDHPIVRQGLAKVIGLESDLMVCGEASSVEEAIKVIEAHQPDLVIVDISLKGGSGIDLIKEMKHRWPVMPALVVSVHEESFFAERVLRAGARGYLTKGESSQKVISSIRAVLNGGISVGEEVASRMIGLSVSGPGSDGVVQSTMDNLTDREFEIFEMLGRGLRSRQIAQRLELSIKTVDSHRENIKKKLRLNGAAELLQHAIQWVQQEQRRNVQCPNDLAGGSTRT
jgi:DNA-binding NarL/FixJ family response regulator